MVDALELVDAPADDAATLGAGVVEARIVDSGAPLATPWPTVQAVARRTATTTMAAIGDAVGPSECFISIPSRR
jgi:hypothetical protein